MKKVRISKKVTALVLVFATMMVCAISASAETLTKSKSIPTSEGIFNVVTDLYVDGRNTYRGAVYITTADSSNAPAYSMFAKAKVTDSHGNMICESRWEVNNRATYWLSAATETGHSSYAVYAGGNVRLGSAQEPFAAANTDLYYAGRAVSADLISTLSVDGNYPKTPSGETYGSTVLAEIVGHEPDLIAAKGTNGLFGYVKNEDLNPEFNCAEDFANYLKSLEKNNWKFPLYDLRGNVIGEFEVTDNKVNEVAPNAKSPIEVRKAFMQEANENLPDGPTIDEIRESYAAQGASTANNPSDKVDFTHAKIVSADTAKANQMNEWLVNGEYKKTADGKTYGPSTLEDVVGKLPDLIAVRGMEGHYGYVKAEDYDPFYYCKTPEDVISLFKGAGTLEERIIPVYDLNGNVIDKYKC